MFVPHCGKISKLKDEINAATELEGSKEKTRSLLEFDVFGKPRKAKIQLPSIMKGQKPGAEPNTRNLTIEGPYKRPLKTSSLASKLAAGSLITSSFELNPGSVNFGILREGISLSTTKFYIIYNYNNNFTVLNLCQ